MRSATFGLLASARESAFESAIELSPPSPHLPALVVETVLPLSMVTFTLADDELTSEVAVAVSLLAVALSRASRVSEREAEPSAMRCTCVVSVGSSAASTVEPSPFMKAIDVAAVPTNVANETEVRMLCLRWAALAV